MDRKRIACLFLACAAAAGGLYAQNLPDLPQFEVENLRLFVLDKQGKRLATLEGAVARKRRDGRIEVEQAVLTQQRPGAPLVLRAPSFLYRQDTSSFECPEGMTATLPDGSILRLPNSTGTVTFGDQTTFKATTRGEAVLEAGGPASVVRAASLPDPEFTVVTDGAGTGAAWQSLSIRGHRGGELRLRAAAAPSLDGRGREPAILVLSCFGELKLDVDNAQGRASLTMLRRARLALEPETGLPKPEERSPFEITSESLNLGGKFGQGAGLSGLEIDAAGNVRVTGPGVSGFSRELHYIERDGLRQVTQNGDPLLDLQQSRRGEPQVFLHLKALRRIALKAPLEQAAPDDVELELEAGAQLWRETDGRSDWQVQGREIWLRSRVTGTRNDPRGNPQEVRREDFRVVGEGYSPLLRVSGVAAPGESMRRLDRAAVFGARGEGEIEDGVADARVSGTDILAVVYADVGLAAELRYALGLRRRPKEASPAPGRLEVRAAESLHVRVAIEAKENQPQPLFVNAAGDVRLDHAALPREDSELVTLTGATLALELDLADAQREVVRLAELTPLGESPCLTTLGFDLLQSRGLRVRRGEAAMDGLVQGPGRIVLRDPVSLEYFRRAVERMPRRGAKAERAPADAGWMDFSGNVQLSADPDRRSMDAEGVNLQLVFGEFEKPRAGRGAANDLPELIDPEVQPLYLARGRRMLAVSSGYAKDPPAVVNLLRLEGDALIRSHADDVQAQARDAMEATGSDDQSAPDSPLAIVLQGAPAITIGNAGAFFGAAVSEGSFSYDGRWVLRAEERLELTFRPLAGDAALLGRARGLLREVHEGTECLNMLAAAAQAVETLREVNAAWPEAATPETMAPVRALQAAINAVRELQFVLAAQARGTDDPPRIKAARREADAARRLLSGLIEVVADRGAHGEFNARESDDPPLELKMERVVVTFNGMGEIADTRAEGPVHVSRGEYTLAGSRLRQLPDGTLELHDAAVTLPANTGVEVKGVQRISLRYQDEIDPAAGTPRRSMVTRIHGKGLGVRVRLSRDNPPAEGNE